MHFIANKETFLFKLLDRFLSVASVLTNYSPSDKSVNWLNWFPLIESIKRKGSIKIVNFPFNKSMAGAVIYDDVNGQSIIRIV